MFKVTTLFMMLSLFSLERVSAQASPEDTMRAGSGGSAGTTQQGPVYDAGVLGPNSAMGGPDVTAVDPHGESYRKTLVTKKPVGTIRLDVQAPKRPEQNKPGSTTK
jgi:hypothetical protein